jgi:hypothetical protein
MIAITPLLPLNPCLHLDSLNGVFARRATFAYHQAS